MNFRDEKKEVKKFYSQAILQRFLKRIFAHNLIQVIQSFNVLLDRLRNPLRSMNSELPKQRYIRQIHKEPNNHNQILANFLSSKTAFDAIQLQLLRAPNKSIFTWFLQKIWSWRFFNRERFLFHYEDILKDLSFFWKWLLISNEKFRPLLLFTFLSRRYVKPLALRRY